VTHREGFPGDPTAYIQKIIYKTNDMARFKRLEVLNTISESGLVPLYYNKDAEIVKKVVGACYEGGARIFEFTNRGDFAHEVFAELNKWCEKECPDMILGVGSVVDPSTAALYIQLGAAFVVSPLLNEEIARVCNRRKIAWIPGAATLSEINNAEALGCEVVKVFPAGLVGGPAYVKSITGPCPWTSVMPSGGVAPTEENLRDWFGAGAFCVGMGSKLITKEIIANSKYDMLRKKMAETLELIRTIRASL
jgi:2-dehydro-3-deoxyphosphogluconate aldolase/(4S)-4-hydroxy-2-oxoglutarate aldolase